MTSKCQAVVFYLLVSAAAAASAELVPQQEPWSSGVIVPDRDISDQDREAACDCCQKCKAATRNLKSQEEKSDEKGVEEKDGCRDCCDKCGRIVPPAPEDVPPEIIKKPGFKPGP